jgi:hypothetical protein
VFIFRIFFLNSEGVKCMNAKDKTFINYVIGVNPLLAMLFLNYTCTAKANKWIKCLYKCGRMNKTISKRGVTQTSN